MHLQTLAVFAVWGRVLWPIVLWLNIDCVDFQIPSWTGYIKTEGVPSGMHCWALVKVLGTVHVHIQCSSFPLFYLHAFALQVMEIRSAIQEERSAQVPVSFLSSSIR